MGRYLSLQNQLKNRQVSAAEIRFQQHLLQALGHIAQLTGKQPVVFLDHRFKPGTLGAEKQVPYAFRV